MIIISQYTTNKLTSLQIGNQNMLLNMDWTGSDAFKASELREWKVDDQVAGLTRSAGKLTFATVDGAGHMVRHYKFI